MLSQLIVTKVSILLKNNELIQQFVGQDDKGARIVIICELRIGSSVQYVQKDIGVDDYDRQKREISFEVNFKLLFENNFKAIELIVELQSTKQKVALIGQMKISEEKKEKSMQTSLKNLQSNHQCEISLQYSIFGRQLSQYIILKNIVCQLKTKPIGSRYALEVESNGRKFRTQYSKDANTWSYLQIYVEQSDILWRLYSISRETILIPTQKLSQFPLREGFRRVFISDQLGLPRGCIQCSYQTKNLRSSEQYQRLAELQKDSQRKVLKLTLKSVKAKFKATHSSFKLRIISGSNFVQVVHNPSQPFTEASLDVGSYLYLQLGQRCQFIVWQNEKAVGFGSLALNIVGFFERRVQLMDPQTKKQIGYIMAKIHSQKVSATLIQLANLKLVCNKKISQLPCYLSFHLPGCYTRTQIRKIEEITYFIRFIILKFTNQENLQVCIYDQNNEEIISSFVSISSLIAQQMSSKESHVIEIDKQSGIFLEAKVYSGDLNNLATKKIQSIKMHNIQQSNFSNVRQSKLLDKHEKKIINQKQTNLYSERLQKSLSNHIKSFRINGQKNKSPTRKVEEEKSSKIDTKPSKSKKKRMQSWQQKVYSSSQTGRKLKFQLQLPNIKPKAVKKSGNPQRLTYLFQIYHSKPDSIPEYNPGKYRK